MSEPLVAVNGINASTGEYLIDPLSPEQVSQLARGEPIDKNLLSDQKQKVWRETEGHFAPAYDVDPNDLSQTGWGVVFAHDADPAVREALGELLEFRRGQAGKVKERYYREYFGPDGYRSDDPDETKRTFLARSGAASGHAADPNNVPYYLLLVGDPEKIPFRFQNQIDVEYGVGRVWFETPDGKPDLEAFARYAHSVVEAESGKVSLPRRAALLGVCNDNDQATKLSSNDLVAPLAQNLTKAMKDWTFTSHPPEQAYKQNLAQLLGGPDTPALLFTASHGVGFNPDDPAQIPHQGALLCQDWPGPLQWRKKLDPEFYFAADDLSSDARLLGLIAFHFACYGAGTPALDDYPHLRNLNQRATIAPKPFLARLPQALLAHPKGGALAVIGHVERAWGCSFFASARVGRQLQTFEDTLRRLLAGQRIGWALECFNLFYAALSADLSTTLEEIKYGKVVDNLVLSQMWTSNNDARSFVVVGDPAVRLPLADKGQPGRDRPVLSEIQARTAPVAAAGAPTSATPAAGPVPAAAPTSPPTPAAGVADISTSHAMSVPSSPNPAPGNPGAGTIRLTIPLQIELELRAVVSGAGAGAVVTAISAAVAQAASPAAAAPSATDAMSFGAVAAGTRATVVSESASASAGPTDRVPNTNIGYYLLVHDESLADRTPEVTERVIDTLAREPITDVILLSHGWMGDVPAARQQYNDWIGAMARQTADLALVQSERPGFRPLLIGLHWPSLPWGDEQLSSTPSFAVGAGAESSEVDQQVDEYAHRLGRDTPEVRALLRQILEASQVPGGADQLTPELSRAYRALDKAIGMGSGGEGAEPGADRAPFDPDEVYADARNDPAEPVSFGVMGNLWSAALSPLRTLSFWSMKDRARLFGETVVHPLLVRMMKTAAGKPVRVRFHIMGHSFGCIVASAGVAGAANDTPLPQPLDSLILVQGALSLWSYCADIPSVRGTPGYFHRIVKDRLVRGAVVTTQSRFDTAVGTWYPRAAWAGGRSQIPFGANDLPRFGGVGAYGLQGDGLPMTQMAMAPATSTARFEPGHIYNLESSQYICDGGGFAGAHGDICKPAVAHAAWLAILSPPKE